MSVSTTFSSFYVGNYNIKMGHVNGKGKGIQRYKLNEMNGEISVASTPQDAGINPTFLCYDDNILYVVNEQDKGMVKSFKVNHEDGSLKLISNVSSKGADPCYCEIFQALGYTHKLLLIANYSSGSTVIFKVLDGGILEEFAFYQHTMEKQGPNLNRQEAPHAHMARPFGDKSNLQIVVPDLGLDKVLQFGLPSSKGDLKLQTSFNMKSGDGPRHIEFHPNKKFAYVVNELSCTVTVIPFDNQNSKFAEENVQTISSLPSDYDNSNGGNTCAHIQMHPNAKFLYVSNRGGKTGQHHSIAVFTANDLGNSLTLSSSTYFEKGKEPRAFSISPSGNYIVVAWQDTDYLSSYQLNLEGNGELIFKHEIESLTPVVVAWVRDDDGSCKI